MTTPQRCPSGLSGRWGEKAPPMKMRRYDRYVVDATKVHELIIISSRLETVYTHFVDGRTQLCTAVDGQPCWIGHEKVSSRWGGWLAVCRPGDRVTRLVQITPGAAAAEPRLEMESIDLRGSILELKRLRGLHNGEMSARIVEGVAKEENLPLEPAMRWAIYRILMAPDRTPGQNAAAAWRGYRSHELKGKVQDGQPAK